MNPLIQPIPWLYNKLWASQTEGGFGYQVTVYKAVQCPCGNTPDSPNNVNCAACGGVGFFYPMPPVIVPMLVSDVNQNMDLMQYGLMQPGDVVVATQPGGLHLDDFDLIIFPWPIGVPTLNQIITRGTSITDTTFYRIVNANGVWTVDSVTGNSTFYRPGLDFTTDHKTITWIHGPNAGTEYTIRYDGEFEWVAYNPPSPRIAFGQDLGQRAVLRKRHLVLVNAPYIEEG